MHRPRPTSIIATATALTAALGLVLVGPGRAGASGPVVVPDPASLVNTFVGTTGGGNVFPGADAPFGMVQWSPDTAPDRSAGGGYEYSDTMLRGFSLTHISGPGCGAYGDVPILPLTGPLPSGDPGSYDTSFTHTGETGTAGYYSVESDSATIRSEFTATPYSSMARFTFPATNQADLLFKLLDSQNGTVASSADVVGNDELAGSVQSGFFCGAPDTYTLHFDITFDHPFTSSKIITEKGQPGPNSVFLTFDTTASRTVQAKVGISFVSAANARSNWQTDNPGWDFNAVRSATEASWNALLGKIQIGGGTAQQQQLFYTALYHSLLHPNIWSDADGQYIGFDQKVHSVAPGQQAQYANYSGWDTYHSQSQVVALVDPRAASDQVTSLLNDDAQSGVMPQWGYANSNNYVMVGDPAQAIIADSYAFGARSFDTGTALADMVRQATTVNDVRPGTALEDQYGYLPDDGTYGCCNAHGFAASLLEYNQADFALAQYAAAVGDRADATAMAKRAQSWQNIFNPADNLIETKYQSGQFASGMSLTSTQGMVEGSASQYRWVVPYNHASLIAAMGGDGPVNTALDSFFTNLDDGSGVGALLTNEFELGVQYFYDYTGQPWKTQEVVNRLRTQVFHDAPFFTDNNDDLGALSSQLLWGMLGMYPEIPGSAQMVLNSPEFPLEVIHLADGNTITVNAPGASTTDFYVQSLKLDGHPRTSLALDPSLLTTGGTLDFTMGSAPNKDWGAAPQDAPPSYGTGDVGAIGFSNAGGQIIVQPGTTAPATIGAQSTWSAPQTVSWTASASSGVTVSPASGSFPVAQGGRRSMPVTITAGSAEGRYTVTFHLTSSTGLPMSKVVLGVAVARPGELWPYYNNTGVADDSNMSAANYDGDGYAYSAQALQAAGVSPGSTVSAGGLSYTWPDVAAGQLDNIQAGGQTIPLNPTTGHTVIGLLGSATNVGSSGSSGTLVVHYSDGTSQEDPVTLSDWTLGAGSFSPVAGNTEAVTTAYRDCVCGSMDNTTTYVYALQAPINAAKTVTSVTLPGTVSEGQFHVFDLVFGS